VPDFSQIGAVEHRTGLRLYRFKHRDEDVRQWDSSRFTVLWRARNQHLLAMAAEDSFENFLADLGERPKGTTLDRINVNGNYEPDNCRWATASEQRRNQRRTVCRPEEFAAAA
jgi:hypothetical protein